MILRRMMAHVKAQNWFAVALDFLIVVMGVFIGTQVSNWNAERLDRRRADAYLARIGADLAADLANYENRTLFWKDVRDYGAVALRYLETGENGGKSDWEIVLASFQASQIAPFYTTKATFEELKSAGELGLIEDASLRSRLSQYYGFGEDTALQESPRYREHVRGLLPMDVQSYIWKSCYASDPASGQQLLDCAAPAEDARLADILGRLRAAPLLEEELRYWLSTMEVAANIVRDRVSFAEALGADVAAARGKRKTGREG